MIRTAALTIIGGLSIFTVYATQKDQIVIDDLFLQPAASAFVRLDCECGGFHDAFQSVTTSIRQCAGYDTSRETVGSFRFKVSSFFEQQNLNGFFYEIPIAKVECEYNGSLEEIRNAVPSCEVEKGSYWSEESVTTREYNGVIETIGNVVQPISIILKPLEPYKAKSFWDSSALSRLPIVYMQKWDILQCQSEYRYDVGLTMICVIESFPQLFVHESGHYYLDSRCDEFVKIVDTCFKSTNDKCDPDEGKRWSALAMTSELIAILFEFKYILTHEDQLKINDAFLTLFRITSMQSQFIDDDYYKVTHLALSLASSDSCLADVANTTIEQLRVFYRDGADVVSLLNQCKVVESATEKEYGVEYDQKEGRVIFKFNHARNVEIMKRWLNKIGYEDADYALQKISGFINEQIAQKENENQNDF